MGDANSMFDGLGDRLSFLPGTPHLAERQALYAELLALRETPMHVYFSKHSNELLSLEPAPSATPS